MSSSSHVPLPFPLSLIGSGLIFAAVLILLGLAALYSRHVRRLGPARSRRILTARWAMGAAFAVWGLAFLILTGLSLVYPFDGRTILVPPGDHSGLIIEIFAYALVPVGLIALVSARVLSYR
jgi:hypothetical protein